MNSQVEPVAGTRTSHKDFGRLAFISPMHRTALVLAALVGWLGLGRFWMGRKDIGILQLLAFIVTFILSVVFANLEVSVDFANIEASADLVTLPLGIWLLIDGILIGTGKARDENRDPLIVFGDDAPRNYRQVRVAEKHTPAVILSAIGITNFLGIDRMYIGRVGLGILKPITLGGIFVLAFWDFIFTGQGRVGILQLITLVGIYAWTLVDFILIGRGKARDGNGRPLIVR